MPYRSFLILSVLLLSGCTASSVVDPLVEAGKVRTPPTQPFRPGVPGRDATKFCNSTTTECKHWTALAIQCEDYSDYVRRDYSREFLLRLVGLEKLLGDKGKLQNDFGKIDPCSQAEQYRKQVSGVPNEGDPGSYSF
jgi:hypothetical protein